MIIWLEDPTKWRYLRKSTGYFKSRRFPVKSLGTNIGGFYKLIGYELIGYDEPNNSPFLFNYYWLKTYDDGCPEVKKCYYGDGGIPAEGIIVKKLLDYTQEQKNIHHCFECTLLHFQKNSCYHHIAKQLISIDQIFNNFYPLACSEIRIFHAFNKTENN